MRKVLLGCLPSFVGLSVLASSAYANEPACHQVSNPQPGVSRCYQRVTVEARRVGYGEGISRGRGESTSIGGWFITGWDTPVSTNSLNGSANLEFIQRGSNFQITSALDELDRALLNTRDQVQSFANFQIAGKPVTVGGLTEKINQALYESQRRRNAFARSQTNVDRVVITAEASGRCTKNVLGTCVDNQGGWYKGYVDVYMVYVGTPNEVASLQQRTLSEVQQGLRVLEQARKEEEQRIANLNRVRYGAFAFSQTLGEYGIAWGSTTAQEAQSAAMQYCRNMGASDCQILRTFNTSGAIARSDDGYTGNAQGNTLGEAEAAALNACRSVSKQPDTCKIIFRRNADGTEAFG